MTEKNEIELPGLEIRTYFVRGRNVLIARADFSELYVDYYLHLAQHGIQYTPPQDEMLKEALAAVALHCASRPWNEMTAWTIHFSDPLLNIFVTGDNQKATVTGQLFTEDVKQDGRHIFLSDTLRGMGEPRRSIVELAEADVFKAVEQYYAQSEQLPARIFRHGTEDFVMVCAHPDCDLAWFEALDDEAIRKLDTTETLSLMEKRTLRWECGCSDLRMLQVLAPMMREDADALFQGDPILRMSCPRCGGRYIVTREAMEAFVHAD